MDMKNTFDTIDHTTLLRTLRSRRLPEEYISLISILYGNQRASMNRSSEFPVQRGVKKRYTLSAILFNCALDIALDEWRLSLHEKDLFIAHGLPRLSNMRMTCSSMRNRWMSEYLWKKD